MKDNDNEPILEDVEEDEEDSEDNKIQITKIKTIIIKKIMITVL